MSYAVNYPLRGTTMVDGQSIVGDHIRATYEELGINPKGLSPTLTDRLNAMDAATVGLADASHTHSGGQIVSGLVDPARLGTGIAPGLFLASDGTWQNGNSGFGVGVYLLGPEKALQRVPQSAPVGSITYRHPF